MSIPVWLVWSASVGTRCAGLRIRTSGLGEFVVGYWSELREELSLASLAMQRAGLTKSA